MIGKRLLYTLPAAAFLVVAGYFYWGLNPDRDPSELPSALIDERMPAFELPPIDGWTGDGLSRAGLEAEGEVLLVNFFASWCPPCRLEHPIFMRLAEQDVVPVYGVNYKDAPADARDWLRDLGDPYDAIGADRSGRTAIDWGVYGVPETYVIDADGRIRYREAGAITSKTLRETILPLIRRLQDEATGAQARRQNDNGDA